MARRDDPFVGVKLTGEMGLDQRLFEAPPDSPGPEPEPQDVRTSVRKDERSSGPPESRTTEPNSVPRELGRVEGKSAPSEVRRTDRPAGRPKGRQSESRVIRNSRRPADLPQWPGQKQRLVDHRPYDFFQDQIRWLNRKKLELEEEYGKRVPATTMVQLAVDLLIADHELNGDDSQLIRVLIKEEHPFVLKSGSPAVGQNEEAGDG